MHDLAAGTAVVQEADPRARLPPLAQAWLGLQLPALWWGVVVWFGVTNAALERGLDAAFGLCAGCCCWLLQGRVRAPPDQAAAAAHHHRIRHRTATCKP